MVASALAVVARKPSQSTARETAVTVSVWPERVQNLCQADASPPPSWGWMRRHKMASWSLDPERK